MATINEIQAVFNSFASGEISKAECMRRMFRMGMTEAQVYHAMQGRSNRGEVHNCHARMQGHEYPYEQRARQARATRTTREVTTTATPQGNLNPVDIYNSYTFGVEFEIAVKAGRYASREEFINALITTAERMGIRMQVERLSHSAPNGYWKITTDASVHDNHVHNDITYAFGVEVVSPILKGADGWLQMEKMCMVFDLVGATVSDECGTHVHIGAGACTWENLRNVAVSYNNAWDAMSGVLPPTRRNSEWARKYSSSAIVDMESCATFADTMRDGHVFADARYSTLACNGHYVDSRYHAVNLVSYKQRKTIEFRAHQGTTNYHKIGMWLRACMELVEWCKVNKLTTQVSHVNDLPWLSQDTKQNMIMRELRYAM